jgi:hypothetical protein
MPKLRSRVLNLKKQYKQQLETPQKPIDQSVNPAPRNPTDLDSFDLDLGSKNYQPQPIVPEPQPEPNPEPNPEPSKEFSTDPLEMFLPLSKASSQDMPNSIDFVPFAQKESFSDPEPSDSWFQNFSQKVGGLKDRVSSIDISLPDISLPDIQPPSIEVFRFGASPDFRPALAVFSIFLALSWLVFPSLATINRGLRLKDNLQIQAAAISELVETEDDTNQIPIRVRGRQLVFKIESTDNGVAWQLGTPRIDVRPDGRA